MKKALIIMTFSAMTVNRYRNIISHTTLTYNRMPIYTKVVI